MLQYPYGMLNTEYANRQVLLYGQQVDITQAKIVKKQVLILYPRSRSFVHRSISCTLAPEAASEDRSSRYACTPNNSRRISGVILG